jgi:hypothetical protein
MNREIACAEVIELDTDHTPQLSAPGQLSDALEHFATRIARPAST